MKFARTVRLQSRKEQRARSNEPFGTDLLKGTPPQPKMQKLGSISFGSWWCGAGKNPAQAPYEERVPTMRKGSYSEELVKILVATQVSEHLEVALGG